MFASLWCSHSHIAWDKNAEPAPDSQTLPVMLILSQELHSVFYDTALFAHAN